jgi:hypothetical protein
MAYQDKLWNDYKSQGEKRIGDFLKERGAVYTYERPVAVMDDNKTKIWYPDFYLDNYHILIEYLGMNGSPKNARINQYKKQVYQDNRFDVVEIYPEDFQADWQGKIDNAIYNTLEQRIEEYVSKSQYESFPKKPAKPYGQMSFELYPSSPIKAMKNIS